MKRVGVILGISALLLLITVSASASTWLTYRDTVDVASGTVDISLTVWHNQTTTETYRNISLPCQISELDSSLTKFAIKANGGDITYNLDVNGVTIKSSQTVTDGNWDNTTLAEMISAGVSDSDTYLNFTFSVSADTNIIEIDVYGDDCALTSSWISNHVTVKEKDVTEPEVGTSSTSAFWTVNDSITVTNLGLGYNLYDVNLTLSYPAHKISTPVSYLVWTSIPADGSGTKYVQYQKYAPYVYKVKDESEGNSHKAIVYIKTRELLTNCVDWTIDPSDEVYDGAFDTLDTSTLSIEYNNVDMDFTVNDDGTITIEDFTVREQYTLNKFVFTWTVAPAVPITPVEVPWYEQTYYGVPLWMIVTAVILILIAIVAITRH
ncbi:hypothetical protein DRN52_03255 [Thermococci archaeon]|nr:MAG: hypothetical protein DRN52_03255 [Thermococci archaeon]